MLEQESGFMNVCECTLSCQMGIGYDIWYDLPSKHLSYEQWGRKSVNTVSLLLSHKS